MKKLSPFIFASILLAVFSLKAVSQQIPNNEFETWTGGKPVSWDASNESVVGSTFTTVTQVTADQHSGASSAKIETITKNVILVGSVTLPGILTLGQFTLDIANQTGNITGGITFPYRPSKLKGYYKAEPGTGDQCMIGVGLSKLNGASRDTIGYGEIFFSTAVTTWTPFEVIIDWTSPDLPDSVNVICASSDLINKTYITGSKLWVDSLYFEYALPGYEIVANEAICTGNTLNWRGNDYTIAGTYYDSLLSTTGADSVYILNLTLLDLPQTYAVTGGGSYPTGGSGLPIGLSGSETGVQYTLFLNGTSIANLNGTGSVLDFGAQTAEGTYTIIGVNVSTGCMLPMTGDAVIIITQMNEISGLIKCSVYPNPAHNVINIVSDARDLRYELCDLSGRILLRGTSTQIEIPGLEKGNYILSVYSDKGLYKTRIQVE